MSNKIDIEIAICDHIFVQDELSLYQNKINIEIATCISKMIILKYSI